MPTKEQIDRYEELVRAACFFPHGHSHMHPREYAKARAARDKALAWVARARRQLAAAAVVALALLVAAPALAQGFAAEAAKAGCTLTGYNPSAGVITTAAGTLDPTIVLDFAAFEGAGDPGSFVARYGFDPTRVSGLVGEAWSPDLLRAWMARRGRPGYVPTRTDRTDAQYLLCRSLVPAWYALAVGTRGEGAGADDSCCSEADNRWGCEPYPTEIVEWCAEHPNRCRTLPAGTCARACLYDANSWFTARRISLVDTPRCRGEVVEPPPAPVPVPEPEPDPAPAPAPTDGDARCWSLVLHGGELTLAPMGCG